MIIQLPNGRIIECSVEQYLSFSDQEIQDLNGLSVAYTKEVGDPFYNKYSNRNSKVDKDLSDFIVENEPALDEIDPYEKLDDPYFHPDDV
jgi:hypothetical protein